MDHIIEWVTEAIKNGHNTLQSNNCRDQRWWHEMYTESLYRELENYKQGNGRLKLF